MHGAAHECELNVTDTTHAIRDEFIGKDAEIIESTNVQLVGLKGTIVDETKNTFTMLVEQQHTQRQGQQLAKQFKKIILKNGSIFRIGSSHVDGSLIQKRSEDRIKLR